MLTENEIEEEINVFRSFYSRHAVEDYYPDLDAAWRAWVRVDQEDYGDDDPIPY